MRPATLLDTLALYLEDLLQGRYVLGLYDGQGVPASLKAGSRYAGPGMMPMRLPAAARSADDGIHEEHPGDSSFRLLWTRLGFADAPHFHWLALAAPAHHSRTQLRAACQLFAQLVTDERDARNGRERLQSIIREQEAIINHISDGLLVLDRNGTLKYCNTTAAEILNFSPQAAVGRPIREVLDFELALNAVFERGEGYTDRELRIESPSLRVHLVDTVVPVWSESGEMLSVVNTFRRIERVKKLSYRMAIDRAHYRFRDIEGESPAIRSCVEKSRRAAHSDASIVLFGESGTGKELFAQAIHAEGARAGGPFIAVNCAALPRDLVESELFGYMPGSFTGADRAGRPGKFELASGGTLFLDEIAEMPLDVQAKLLRVLQEKRVLRIGASHSIPVDIRIVAASHRRLIDRVADGLLREDLYYRLNVIEIEIPALRERADDMPYLLQRFLTQYASASRSPIPVLSPQAFEQLAAYHWPGNIRELQNIAERLVHMNDHGRIEHIPASWFILPTQDPGTTPADDDASEELSLSKVEEATIRRALRLKRHNLTQAAAALGITRPTLYAKMRRYGIARLDGRAA